MKKTAPARAKSAKDKPIWAKVVIGRGTFSTNPKSLRRCTHHPSAAYATASARAPAPKAMLVSSGSPIPANAEAWSSAITGNMIASPIMNVMLTNAVISAMSTVLRPRGA